MYVRVLHDAGAESAVLPIKHAALTTGTVGAGFLDGS